MALNDFAALQQRAEDGCELIRNTSGVFEHARQCLMRRAARCGEAQGQHFEHIL
jgi:hypothetical protein